MKGQSDAYPDAVEVDSFMAGHHDAVYKQLVSVAVRHPRRTREFAQQAAVDLATRFCTHGKEVPRSSEGTTSASRAASIAADGGHKGLCGKHQAHIIARVRTGQVIARYGTPIATKYRNQVRPRIPRMQGSCLLDREVE